MASGLTEAADLIVEDGTIVADANSYIDFAFADAYVNLRQDATLIRWTEAGESDKVAALIIATDYVDRRWCFESTITDPGTDVLAAQSLQWPRLYAIDSRGVIVLSDEIPTILQNAVVEYAVRSLDATTFEAGALLVDPAAIDDSGRFITEKLEQVGPLREQTKYSESKATKKWASYGTADEIMRSSGLVVLGAGSMAIRG